MLLVLVEMESDWEKYFSDIESQQKVGADCSGQCWSSEKLYLRLIKIIM